MLLVMPAPVHALADVHDTLLSELKSEPSPGVGWICQVVPFQRSASVPPPLALLSPPPTAVQTPSRVHDTADRLLSPQPDGIGTDWICHAIPSRCSANGMTVPALSVKEPTAVHPVKNVHDTPESELD
jgi:hypothetical protein